MQIIVKTKKVKEAEKFVSQKIFEYDNSQISEYDDVDTECLNWRTNYLLPYRGCLNVPTRKKYGKHVSNKKIHYFYYYY
jgi:hypothetical protein